MLNVWQRYVTDDEGNVIDSPEIEVRDEESNDLIPLFSDVDGNTSLGNPFTGGSDGFVRFYAAAGRVRIEVTKNTSTSTFRYVQLGSSQSYDVGIVNPYEATDAGTDAFQFDAPSGVEDGDIITVTIPAANTTPSPTGENTSGTPSGAQNIVTSAGSAYIGMLQPRAHDLQWDKDNTRWVVLDPAPVETVVDPITFGAAGDGDGNGGGTNDVTKIQAAIDALSDGATLDLLGRTYRVDSTLTGKSGISIINGYLDFSNAVDGDTLIEVEGSEGTEEALNANASEGDTSVSVADESGFSEGQYVLIGSNAVYDASDTSSPIGEINIVAGTSAGTVDLEMPLQQGYATADSAGIVPLTMAERFRLENVRARGAVSQENGQAALKVVNGRDITVRGCRFERFDDRDLWLEDVVESLITENSFRSAKPTSTGYGISFVDASQDCIASNNHFRDVRHALSTNNTSANRGIPRRIKFIENNVLYTAFALGGSMGGGDAIDTHSAAEDIEVINNTVHDSSGIGINFECSRGVVMGNTIFNSANIGIHVHNESDRSGEIIVANNRIRKTGNYGLRVSQGIRGTTAIMRSVVVSGNMVSQASLGGIYIDENGGVNVNISVSSNTVYDTGNEGIRIDGARGVSISGNTVRAPGTFGIRTTDAIHASINGNSVISNAGSALIYLTAASSGANVNSLVVGNACGPSGGSTSEFGIQLSNNVDNVLIDGNNVAGTGGISTGTGTGHVTGDNIT